jgi:hypothetical protein
MLTIMQQQAQVIESYENLHIRNTGRGEAQKRKCNRLELGGCQAYDCSSD